MVNLPINCEFCDKPLKFSRYEDKEEAVVYDCIHCPVLTSFHFFRGDICLDSRVKTVFMIDKSGRTYLWTNNYLSKTSYITDLSAVDMSSAFIKNMHVVQLPLMGDINPSNVYKKFSFVMTFL